MKKLNIKISLLYKYDSERPGFAFNFFMPLLNIKNISIQSSIKGLRPAIPNYQLRFAFVFVSILALVFSPLSELARLYLPERLADQVAKIAPETPSALAAINTDVFIFHTVASGSSFTVPADWNPASNSIEVIGAGGGGAGDSASALGVSDGGGGGGGGGYSKITNLSLTPGNTVVVGVGTGGTNGVTPTDGGHTFFNAATFAACTDNTVCVKAEGGEGGNTMNSATLASSSGGDFATTASAVGTTRRRGGDGGRNHTTTGTPGGGGGGAAGKFGNGANGANAATTAGFRGSGGGGNDNGTAGSVGTSATAGGTGGNGYGGAGSSPGGAGGASGGNGTNGGGGGGSDGDTTTCGIGAGGTGSLGGEWVASTFGSGGGGGGGGGCNDTSGAANDGGAGGSPAGYGGGGGGGGGNADTGDSEGDGGDGGNGLIVIKYRPLAAQTHFRWYNDDGGGASGAGDLFYNPTGNGFANNFTINAGCSAGSEWDCVDDDTVDTSASAPTSDNGTSSLQSAVGKDYYTLADDAIEADNAVITRIGVAAYAADTGQPNTDITLGYCVICDGANDQMAGLHDVGTSNTKYSDQFTGLSLTTTDLNNVQLVVQASGVNAAISTVYASISYTFPAATQISAEDTKASGSEALAISSTYRLRLQIANQKNYAGTTFNSGHKYRLEMTRAGTSCTNGNIAAGWTWKTVPVTPTLASHAFDIEPSTFISDGASTSAAVMSTPTGAATFVSGYQLTTRATSGYQTIPDDAFTEISWNLKPNSNANTSADYCFRAGWIVDDTTTPDTLSSMSYSKIASASVQAATSPTFTQNHYQWRYNADSVDPGAAMATQDNSTEIITLQQPRLRVNITVGTANLTASSSAFKLKYATAVGGPYTDVGATNSFETWKFFENPSVAHGTTVSTTLLLTGSDIRGIYQASNSMPNNPKSVATTQDVEYDFSLDALRAQSGTTYYFRVFEDDDTPLAGQNFNPTIVISSFVPPGGGGGEGGSFGGGSGGGAPIGGGGQGGGDGGACPEGNCSGGGGGESGGGAGGGGGGSPIIFLWQWLKTLVTTLYQ